MSIEDLDENLRFNFHLQNLLSKSEFVSIDQIFPGQDEVEIAQELRKNPVFTISEDGRSFSRSIPDFTELDRRTCYIESNQEFGLPAVHFRGYQFITFDSEEEAIDFAQKIKWSPIPDINDCPRIIWKPEWNKLMKEYAEQPQPNQAKGELNFEAGVVVYFEVEPTTCKELKRLFKLVGEVCFVDYEYQSETGYARFKSSRDAYRAVQYFNRCGPIDIRMWILVGKEEQEYWQIIKDGSNKKNSAPQKPELNRNHLKFEEDKQAESGRHIVFDESGSEQHWTPISKQIKIGGALNSDTVMEIDKNVDSPEVVKVRKPRHAKKARLQ